jgi:O-antigen/teichoic acid export membrane protein
MGNETNESGEVYVDEITRVAKGAGIVFVGAALWGGLIYLYHIYLARVLGPNSYGLYALGLAVFNILSIVSLMGMHYGLLRFVALYSGERDSCRIQGTILSALWLVTVVSVLSGGLLFVLADVISVNIFQKEDFGIVLRFFGVAIFFSGLISVFIYSTQGFQVMKYRVYVQNLWDPIGRICIATFLFAFGFKLLGAVIAHVLTLIVGAVLAYGYLRKLFPFDSVNVQPIFETRRLLRFSFPLFIVSVLEIGRTRGDRLVLGCFLSSDEVGLYTAAFQTSILVLLILISFSNIFAPMISDLHNRGEYRKLASLFKTVTKWILTLTVPVLLFLFFFAREILGLFGEQFIFASLSLKILLFGQMAHSGIGSAGLVLNMSGYQKVELLNNLGAVAIEFPLCLLLIPKYGIVGAAVAVTCALVLLSILRVIEVYTILKIHPYRIDVLKPIAAGGLLAFFLFFLQSLHLLNITSVFRLIVYAFLSFVVYGFFICLFGLTAEDLFVLRRLKQKFGRRKM